MKYKNRTASTIVDNEAQAVDEYDEDCDNDSKEEEGGIQVSTDIIFMKIILGMSSRTARQKNLR